MSKDPFWLVWCPTGPHSPRVRIDSEDEATRAAENLARSNPGKEFFVLRAVSRSVKRDVDTERLGDESDREIPF